MTSPPRLRRLPRSLAQVEELQNHRSSAIAKRAARMWKRYFVSCAICNTPYTRHSPAISFCAECKCNVCAKCDCTVFHLSYQDQLWKELAEGEAKKEKSKKTKHFFLPVHPPTYN